MKILNIIYILIVIALLAGCSTAGKSPVSGPMFPEGDLIEDGSFPGMTDSGSGLGLFGAYNLTISPYDNSAELIPMRTSAIGESIILSGTSYFTNYNCLRIKSIGFDVGSRAFLTFEIKHPFKKGNTGEAPSSTNRLDLDIFDLALVAHPRNITPTSFNLVDTYSGVIYNTDGYTTELANVIGDSAALPYKICYANSNNNRFEMGTSWREFTMLFALEGTQEVDFDLYLTMGYGVSAILKNRLSPTYYVPEFNRKAAWKVSVDSEIWIKGDTTTQVPVIIDVYDWNHGATVASSYPDPDHKNHIYQQSDVVSVQVEIPDLLVTTPVSATSVDTSSNGWDDPISYIAYIANNNAALGEGVYTGLVRVVDSRTPGTSPVVDGLYHSDDGAHTQYFTMPEFATYQTFQAKVGKLTDGYGWGRSFGSTGSDVGMDIETDSESNIYITGFFSGTVDFDPGDGTALGISNGDLDIFLVKIDKLGNFQWVKTWGGVGDDQGLGVVVDENDGVYLVGEFNQTMDLDPDAGVEFVTSNGSEDAFLIKLSSNGTYLWGTAWGGTGEDSAQGVAVINASGRENVYVTGYFEGTVDFDPGITIDQRSSHGQKDAFLVWYGMNTSEYLDVNVWGGNLDDRGKDVVTNDSWFVFVTGFYESTVDFDPDPVGVINKTSNGGRDIFVTNFAYHGNHEWVRVWGGPGEDKGNSIAYSLGFGGVYITGCYSNTVDFDPGISTFDNHTSNGGQDVFLSRFSSFGEYTWSRTWGGLGIWDEGHGVEVSSAAKVYVTGAFQETVDFDPSAITSDERTSIAGSDIFVSMFDDSAGNGVYGWVYTIGGLGIWDEGHGIDVGSIYITGQYSESMDFDPTSGQDWHASNGNTDIFLIKLIAEGSDESEPNDTCETADQIGIDIDTGLLQIGYQNGTVRESVDDVDYWWFIPEQNVINVDIYLYNESGHNIDLYLLEEDCVDAEGSSLNPGGANEFISTSSVFGNTMYKIQVQNVDDGFLGNKDYYLVVEITYYM